MKKKLILAALVLVVLLVAALVILPVVFINPLVKAGVEKSGPLVAKVETRLTEANISIFSGHGTLNGLFVGNPPGFKTPAALTAGEITLGVKPGSLLGDKVVVTTVRIINPQITFEGGLMKNNFSKILENVQTFTGPGKTNAAAPGGRSRKLQVDELVLSGAKVTVSTELSEGKPVTFTLPDIRLAGLGTGPDGITGADLTAVLLKEISAKTIDAAMSQAGKLGSAALENASKNATKKLEGAVGQGLEGLLKKKP